jgi:sugar transferase (PEP-CTERM/EpsH1 system associated)
MEPLLYLTHRIPFPPNKGDKVRSYHLLRYLAARYRVYLGTFVDDDADWEHVPAVEALCEKACVRKLVPVAARARSLAGLLTGDPLTLPYYRDRELLAWVANVVADERITRCVIFSSAMARYLDELPGLKKVIDFVDVDSAKWSEYARRRSWPMSWLYRREGEKLLAFERDAARRADAVTFVTAAEAELFRRLAPESADRIRVVENGVDADLFSPAHALPSPYPAGEQPIAFTGAMDYWPNVDAVTWFAREVLPGILAAHPAARFYIVGMKPGPEVNALATERAVRVTGRVPDTRPYLAHARVAVAPLRVARGVQNKVLEAMAMARPVVVSGACATQLDARPGEDLEVAETAVEFARKVIDLLSGGRGDRLGRAARQRVLERYGWQESLARLDPILGARSASPRSDAPPEPAELSSLTSRASSR